MPAFYKSKNLNACYCNCHGIGVGNCKKCQWFHDKRGGY